MNWLEQIKTEIIERFQALQLREQILLLSCGFIGIVYAVLVFGWEPLSLERSSLTTGNPVLAQELSQLQQSAANLEILSNQGIDISVPTEAELNRMIEISVSKYGLKIKRFQPGKEADMTFWIETADFTRVARWIHEMEQQLRINLLNAKITADKKQGFVNTQVRIKHRNSG